MPHGKEGQSGQLTVKLRAEEFQSLVNVFRAPVICIDVERQNVMVEFRGIFKSPEFYVSATIPLVTSVFVFSIVRQTEYDANLRRRMHVACYTNVKGYNNEFAFYHSRIRTPSVMSQQLMYL